MVSVCKKRQGSPPTLEEIVDGLSDREIKKLLAFCGYLMGRLDKINSSRSSGKSYFCEDLLHDAFEKLALGELRCNDTQTYYEKIMKHIRNNYANYYRQNGIVPRRYKGGQKHRETYHLVEDWSTLQSILSSSITSSTTPDTELELQVFLDKLECLYNEICSDSDSMKCQVFTMILFSDEFSDIEISEQLGVNRTTVLRARSYIRTRLLIDTD